MHLISLIGEQPLPILLPARYIQPQTNLLIHTANPASKQTALRLMKILPDAQVYALKAHPYDFDALLRELAQQFSALQPFAFNLTGGTKIMALAGYECCRQAQAPFYYYESEAGHDRLYTYTTQTAEASSPQVINIPALLTLDDFLHAHLNGYHVDVVDAGSLNYDQQKGFYFERAVAGALAAAGFDVLANIRPDDVADQIEIDLLLRLGNQVGVCEVKLGDKKGDLLKKGLDQLNTIGRREYLGTYTHKFLICARALKDKLRQVAAQSKITVIDIPPQAYDENRHYLEKYAAETIARQIKEKFHQKVR